ncbi:MAG TPA: isoprenylcysteine carboxylmethyltransferase family protein [Rhizomicrobium sp.]|nr:isoprenylcysteine carboxylmethyltransferase family protein [Rhizomicrobium sp.]
MPHFLRRGTKAYDILAASPLIVWYVYCCGVQFPHLAAKFAAVDSPSKAVMAWLDLLSKTSVFVFALVLIALLIVRRSPVAATRGWAPRAIAFLGCYLGIGLLTLPTRVHGSPWFGVSAGLIFAGTTFALYSLLWLGRSISIMPEGRKLVTSGPYSMVRHPLYLGEQLALVGVALLVTSPWAIALLVLQFCCQLYRMNYEEGVLSKAFPEYVEYMLQTDRLIPWLY